MNIEEYKQEIADLDEQYNSPENEHGENMNEDAYFDRRRELASFCEDYCKEAINYRFKVGSREWWDTFKFWWEELFGELELDCSNDDDVSFIVDCAVDLRSNYDSDEVIKLVSPIYNDKFNVLCKRYNKNKIDFSEYACCLIDIMYKYVDYKEDKYDIEKATWTKIIEE